MQTYQVLLIGNGETVSPALLKQLAKKADYILAADAGADKALRAGITPHGIIGDLDSVSVRTKKRLADKMQYVPTQDNTDLEKALNWIKKHKFTQATLVGFVGGRWDFSIGNLLTLAKYARWIEITLVSNKWRIYPLVHSAQFCCTKNKRVSIIALKTCTRLTLSGLKFPLHNARLTAGTTRTLSNETTGKKFGVRFDKGCLLVYQEI